VYIPHKYYEIQLTLVYSRNTWSKGNFTTNCHFRCNFWEIAVFVV